MGGRGSRTEASEGHAFTRAEESHPHPLFFCSWDLGAEGGRVGIEFGGVNEVGADGVCERMVTPFIHPR